METDQGKSSIRLRLLPRRRRKWMCRSCTCSAGDGANGCDVSPAILARGRAKRDVHICTSLFTSLVGRPPSSVCACVHVCMCVCVCVGVCLEPWEPPGALGNPKIWDWQPLNLALAANAKPGALPMQGTAASGGSKWSRGDQGGAEHRLRSDLLAVCMPICESRPIRAQLHNSVVH
jgi:hypothetical protein